MTVKREDYLKELDPNRFVELMAARKTVIENSKPLPLPKDEEYPVNNLARELHPKRQYLYIDKVDDHGSAKSYYLKPDEARGTKTCAYFRAGQYVSVFLEIMGAKVSKPYSIRSGPGNAKTDGYILTVKRTGNGYASSYILEHWKAGDKVEVSGPEGNFYYEELRDSSQIIGIAGGSGITPFYSLACAIAEGIENCFLTLLYGSRGEKDILFKKEFDELVKKCPKLQVIHVLSDEEKEGYEHGFITAELIRKYSPSGEDTIFMCGPQAMYQFADGELEKLHIPPRRVRHELFGEYQNPEKETDYPQDCIGKSFCVTVSIRGEKQDIICKADETLLNAMEKAGIAAPSRCRSGECGFCHSRLVSGDVYIPSQVDGRRLADRKFGYVHPCCTFPVSDVEIDVPVISSK